MVRFVVIAEGVERGVLMLWIYCVSLCVGVIEVLDEAG